MQTESGTLREAGRAVQMGASRADAQQQLERKMALRCDLGDWTSLPGGTHLPLFP